MLIEINDAGMDFNQISVDKDKGKQINIISYVVLFLRSFCNSR